MNNLKIKILIFVYALVFFVISFSGCSKAGGQPQEKENVFLEDENNGEIIIGENSVSDAEQMQTITEQVSRQEKDKTDSGGTQVSTMYDGYGNKTERRFFYQHPFIEAVVLRTANNGQKEVLLFGHNGEVKSVPQNMIERAMTASADELAQATGILQGRKPKVLSFTDLAEPKSDAALLPQPGSESSSNSQIAETEKAEKADKSKPENPNIKNESQNLKQAEIEYQAEINKANLRAKKFQTEKNNNR